MASTAFRIICDAELGESPALPIGRNSARSNDGAGDRGYDKKRTSVSNKNAKTYPVNPVDWLNFPYSFLEISQEKVVKFEHGCHR